MKSTLEAPILYYIILITILFMSNTYQGVHIVDVRDATDSGSQGQRRHRRPQDSKFSLYAVLRIKIYTIIFIKDILRNMMYAKQVFTAILGAGTQTF